MSRKALITGISGQVGSYLAELLLIKGYEVWGIIRRKADHRIPENLKNVWNQVEILWGDITDKGFVDSVFNNYRDFSLVFHAGAFTHVGQSFHVKSHCFDVNYSGTEHILEAIRKHCPNTRMFFFATSEMFGGSKVYNDGKVEALNELSRLQPRSPYAISKVAAYELCRHYRQAYNMNVSCGIIFNNESPRRGKDFVTMKISNYAARFKAAKKKGEEIPKLELGNITACRDWGYSPDYCEAIYSVITYLVPEDFVIATGETHSIKEYFFGSMAAAGQIVGEKSFSDYVSVSESEKRPLDVDVLLGDPTKIERVIGWKPQIRFKNIVKILFDSEYSKCK